MAFYMELKFENSVSIKTALTKKITKSYSGTSYGVSILREDFWDILPIISHILHSPKPFSFEL